jgi:riboflavin synthase alpha subunit
MWQQGKRLNLERPLRVGDELGGHIVTGHVDDVVEVVAVERVGDSTALTIASHFALAPFIAAKGSIALDGVSLTVNEVQPHPAHGRSDHFLARSGRTVAQCGSRPDRPLSGPNDGATR